MGRNIATMGRYRRVMVIRRLVVRGGGGGRYSLDF
jgi:hypothetical protein